MDSTISITSLPLEVIVEIMNKLSVPTRGKCRLICRKWYDICSVFERKERICIGRMYKDCLDEIMLSLSVSLRSCFHFEFYCLNLGDDNYTRRMFWETCGPKIMTLKLCYSELSTHALANILRYCSNLHTLEFYFHSIYDMREGGLSVACLKECVDLKLRNESLKTLKIYFGDRPTPLVLVPTIENNWSFDYLKSLVYLFSLFPNVSNFASHKRNWISYSDRFRGNPRHIGNAEELMDLLHEYLSRDQMESIAISWLWLSLADWTSFITILSSRTTKMTEMILFDSKHYTFESFLSLVSRQTNLQTITYIFSNYQGRDEIRESIHFISLLRNVPTICRLRLVSIQPYVSETGTVHSTSRSRCYIAERLSAGIEQENLSKGPFPLIEKVTATNSIEPSAPPLLDIPFLLNYFPNLKDLRLSSLNVATLETLCSMHPKLESLVVNSRGIEGKAGLIPLKFINSFKELRYLEIPESLKFYPWRFNRLKYLHIVRHFRNHPSIIPNASNTSMHDSYLSKFLLRPVLMSYQLACPSLKIACFDLDCSIVTYDQEKRTSSYLGKHWATRRPYSSGKKWIKDVLADFVADLENLKFVCFNCHARSFYAGRVPTYTETDVSHIFKRSESLHVLIIFKQIFFKHAMENRVCEMTKDNLWHNTERYKVFEFLEMFLGEDKERWFQESYFTNNWS